jgi:hypothetical protein
MDVATKVAAIIRVVPPTAMWWVDVHHYQPIFTRGAMRVLCWAAMMPAARAGRKKVLKKPRRSKAQVVSSIHRQGAWLKAVLASS